MSALIWLIVVLIVFGLIVWLLDMLPLPVPFHLIARVIVVLIFLLVLVDHFGIYHFR